MSLNYPSTTEDQKFFNEELQKLVDSIYRVKAEQDLVKTICNGMKEAYGSDPASVKKLAKLLSQETTDGLMDEVEELVTTFDLITKGDK